MASWQPVQVEVLNYRRDGTAFWVELNIQPIADDAGLITHWVSIQRDVTRRRHAEEALRSNEARLAAATDAARLGIFETDLPSGRITWTGYHEAMWGYAPGEFDGTFAMFEQRIHPQDRAKVVAEVEASRQHGSPFVREYRVVWPDDSVHWVLVHGRHVLDAYGQPTRAYGVAMDVTDRMLAQQRIEQANQRIGTLLQTMTIGFLTIDRQWRFTYVNPRGSKLMGGDPNTGHWFEADVHPSEEGASLFFRDITRRKRTEEETQALVRRLQALREMDGALLQALSFDEIGRLGASRMRALTNAWGDHRLVGVLLVNLLDNAWKFSSRTSAARIEVGATTNAAGQTEYFVADNGAGFDMDHADKLFGAFQRLHSTSEFSGSGIGLTTVQRIAMRHAGTVSAESVPGMRTVIRFTLAPALNPV